MTKPPAPAHKPNNPASVNETTRLGECQAEKAQVSKTPPMAEIILFPNAKETIAGISELQTDPETKARWLHLADEVLESSEGKKKA